MTQRDMAGYLGVTTVTIRNWRKNKPELYEIVLKGFAFDEIVEQSKKSYEEAKSLQEKYKN
jgi:transcriptional regulator with XRE-family HTH domain